MSAACVLGHDWNNSLVCRLCPATRTPEEAILAGLASRRGGDEASARTLLDAYRIGVLTEVTAWLVKKARVFRSAGGSVRAAQADAIAALASKVGRGAVRANNLQALPADFYEVGHTYEYAPLRLLFRCDAVGAHPVTGEPSAVGWVRYHGSGWSSGCYSPAEYADGWTDITDTTGDNT